MELEYGVSAAGELIHIERSIRGRTQLKCPFCGVGLIARQGSIVAWHFAHDGPTCLWASSGEGSLPMYDQFGIQLPRKVYEEFMQYTSDRPDNHRVNISRLISHELVQFNDYTRQYELTRYGKIVVGQLTLKPFLEYQEPYFLQRHNELVRDIEKARTPEQTAQREMNLKIYRLQWQRVLQCALYLIQIDHSAGTLYKVGVTRRDIGERLAEIQADLKPHFGDVTLTVLDTWSHRGSVEFYVKHRYRQHQHQLGTLTEYFSFPDVKKVLSHDLRRMPRRELTAFERDVLSGKPAPHEQKRLAEQAEQRRREAIREGMKRSAEHGQHVGRPARPEDAAVFLAKPTSQAVIQALNAGLSVRRAADQAGVSTTTVQKVQRALADTQQSAAD